MWIKICELLVIICCGWYMFHMIAVMGYCIHCHISQIVCPVTNVRILVAVRLGFCLWQFHISRHWNILELEGRIGTSHTWNHEFILNTEGKLPCPELSFLFVVTKAIEGTNNSTTLSFLISHLTLANQNSNSWGKRHSAQGCWLQSNRHGEQQLLIFYLPKLMLYIQYGMPNEVQEYSTILYYHKHISLGSFFLFVPTWSTCYLLNLCCSHLLGSLPLISFISLTAEHETKCQVLASFFSLPIMRKFPGQPAFIFKFWNK